MFVFFEMLFGSVFYNGGIINRNGTLFYVFVLLFFRDECDNFTIDSFK